jgi:hypothetical protein
MSFEVGKPIDVTAAEQLLLRQEVIGDDIRLVGTEQSYGFFFEKTPWIKLSSGVDLANTVDGRRVAQRLLSNPSLTGDELAKRNILFNLTEKDLSQISAASSLDPQALAGAPIKSKGLSDLPGYELSDTYGVRPLPGILSMNLRTHNTFGSLRTATVNFVCWTVEQLEVLEVLFMRPGYTALLEWGHSRYLYREADTIKTDAVDTYAIDFFGTNKKRSVIAGLLDRQRKKYQYNYDGMYGVVKNFSWSLRPDGGYDCRIDIVSTGEIIESLKINTSVTGIAIKRIESSVQEPIKPGVQISEDEKQQTQEEVKKKFPLLVDNPAVAAKNYGQTTAVQNQVATPVVAPGISTATSNTVTQAIEKSTKEVPPISTIEGYKSLLHYILLIGLRGRIRSNVSAFNQKTGYFSLNLEDYVIKEALITKDASGIDPEYKESLYAIFDTATKVDSSQEDNELTTFYYIKLGLLLEVINSVILTSGIEDEPFFKLETNRTLFKYKTIDDHVSIDPAICLLPDTANKYVAQSKKTYQENILEIFVGIEHVTSILNGYIDAEGEVNLYTFLEHLLKDIKVATGGLNDFQLQYFEDSAKFAIIDRNVITAFAEQISQIDIIGKSSVVLNFNLTSKLSPRLGHMVAISAQASPYSTGIEGTGLAFFNKGLIDRIITERNDSEAAIIKTQAAAAAQAEAVEQKLIELQKLAQVQAAIIQLYGKETVNGLPYYTYDQSAIASARSQYTSYIPYLLGQKNNPAYAFVVPFELELTLEGIAGFRIMESFRVNKQILPYTYKGTQDNDIAFLITGLEHQVNKQAWTTTVKAQIYITGDKYITRRHVLRDLKDVPRIQSAGNTRAIAGSTQLKQVLLNAGYVAGTPEYEFALAIGTNEGWDNTANAGRGTRAYRNNNPGNLNYQASFTSIDPNVTLEEGENPRFAHFTTAELGAKALVETKIKRWASGNMPVTSGNTTLIPRREKWQRGTPPTLAQFIYTYAPPSDGNNTERYIAGLVASLSKSLGKSIARSTVIQNLLA